MADTELKNDLLRGAAQQVEAGLTPENRANYLKVVVMGLNVGLNGGKDGALASLRDSKDVVSDCALGAVNLIQLLKMNSQGTMPEQAAAPAGFTLMLVALDFAASAGLIEIDMETIVRATHLYTNQAFKVNGITPQMLARMGVDTQGVMENPGQLELLRRRAGVVRDPGASTPVAAVPPPRNRAERRRQARRR